MKKVVHIIGFSNLVLLKSLSSNQDMHNFFLLLLQNLEMYKHFYENLVTENALLFPYYRKN